MAEKMTKANLFGSEYSLVGKSSGGGGAGMGVTTANRWLRFNFNDPNHKSLRILGGTSFLIGNDLVEFEEDFIADFSSYISEEGCDYYVFLNKDKNIICGTLRDVPEEYIFIGQFHTLCRDVGSNVTSITARDLTSQVGQFVDIQDYDLSKDKDFYDFYHKSILTIDSHVPYYNVVTINHPLSGFKAKDILPESVWCLNFHPSCKNWDGMLYCNTAKKAVDIYLPTGWYENLKTEYGAVRTVAYRGENLLHSYSLQGKGFLTLEEFSSVAEGSNEKSVIEGNQDPITVGGHVDTNGRRMISNIGCEDCVGVFPQYLFPVWGVDANDYVGWDGVDALGIPQDNPWIMTGGSSFAYKRSTGPVGGSRSFNSTLGLMWDPISAQYPDFVPSTFISFNLGRGCCTIDVV